MRACVRVRESESRRAHTRAGVCRVLAGVSDNEMQQGTKSWGPLFSVLQLHFHSRHSMIPP